MVQGTAYLCAIGCAFLRNTFHAGNPDVFLQTGKQPALFGQYEGVQIHIVASLWDRFRKEPDNCIKIHNDFTKENINCQHGSKRKAAHLHRFLWEI